MPLMIQLIDRDGRPFAGASLVLQLVMRDGAERTTEPMRADDLGRIRMDGLDQQQVRAIQPRKSTFVMTYRGETSSLQPLVRPQPAEGAGQMIRLEVAGMLAEQALPPTPPPPPAPAPADHRPADIPNPPKTLRRRVVSGQVRNAAGEAVEDLLLRAFDRQVGKAEPLGEARSGRNGRYRIAYAWDAEKQGRPGPDLIVRLFGPEGDEPPLLSSGLIPGAGAHERVDFALDATRAAQARPQPLFARIAAAVAAEAGAKDFAGLDAEDAVLIAARHGLNPRSVARALRGFHLAGELDPGGDARSLAPVLFGLIETGLTGTARGILAQGDAALRRRLVTAQSRNLVGDFAVDEAVARLGGLRAGRKQADTPLRRLIAAAGAGEQGAEVEAVLLSDHPAQQQWEKIAGIAGQKRAKALREAMAMSSAAGGQPLLVAHLLEKGTAKDRPGLAALEPAQLAEAAKQSGSVPDGKDAEEFAGQLARRIETSLPHEHFLARMARSKDERTRAAAGSLGADPALRLDQPATLAPLEAAGSARRGEAELASLFQVSPPQGRAAAAEALVGKGYRSSRAIVAPGRTRFRESMEGALPKGEANRIFNRAQHAENAATAKSAPANAPLPSAARAGWAAVLFGDQSDAGCGHCASVLGPGAYLLDLYRYLGRAEVNGISGTTLLAQRRPEIPGLLLDCGNSETELPYIDLVLEVLEDVVAGRRIAVRQTSWDAAQLAAESEHVHLPAYARIKGLTFPWQLPFDRQNRRATACLDQAGAPRAALIALLEESELDCFGQEEAALVLGLSSLDAIALDGDVDWRRDYGVAARAGLTAQAGVDALARWLQVPPTDLAALLASTFVNPNGLALIRPDATLDWDTIKASVLVPLQALGRLWRASGVPIADLDALLTLPQLAGLPGPKRLHQLAAAIALARAWGVTNQMLAGWLALPDGEAVEQFALRLGTDAATFTRLAAPGAQGYLPVDFVAAQRQSARAGVYGLPPAALAWLCQPDPVAGYFGMAEAEEAIAGLRQTLDAVEPVAADTPGDALAGMREAVTEVCDTAFGPLPGDFPQLLASADDLLTRKFMAAGGVDHASFGATASAALTAAEMLRLAKLAAVMQAGGIAAGDIAAISQLAPAAGWADPSRLPAASADPAITPASLIDLLDHHQASSDAGTESLFALLAGGGDMAALAGALGWPSADPAALGLADLPTAPDQLLAANGIVRIEALLRHAQTVSADPAALARIAQQGDGDGARDILWNALGDAGALAALEQINGRLRESQRDGLLAALIHASRTPGQRDGFDDADDVYEHYLIDPAMASCFLTSRLVAASGSLQQLISRIQLGLEGKGGFADEDLQQWDWRKNYRVWEANRKVFLFPENWIEPELRDDKTALYEELESSLLQGEVTADLAETTLLSFARGLHSLARLEMVATLEDEARVEQIVFARTGDLPHRYFTCSRGIDGFWQGWRAIDAEIDSDYLLPVLHDGRLFLFWASVAERIDNSSDEYISQLAEIDAEEELLRSDLGTYSRQIDDFGQKAAEFSELADGMAAPLDATYEAVARSYTQAAAAAETSYEETRSDLAANNRARERLNREFTYLEIALNWSQREKDGSWRPAKKSTGTVDTIFRQGSETLRVRTPGTVWLRARTGGGTLAIELRANEDNHGNDITDLRIGTFTFDPLLEALVSEDGSVGEKLHRPDRFPTGYRNGQRLGIPWPFRQLDVAAGENAPATLLAWDDINYTGKIWQEEIGGYDPGQSPFLFARENQSYIAEPGGIRTVLRDPVKDVARPVPHDTVGGAAGISGHVMTGVVGFDPGMSSASFSAGTAMRGPGGMSAARMAGGMPANAVAAPAVTLDEWQDIELELKPDRIDTGTGPVGRPETGGMLGEQTWRMGNFYHPFTQIIVGELYKRGLDGLYRPDPGSGRTASQRLFRQQGQRDAFTTQFTVQPALAEPYPLERFEFDRTAPYAAYNWEIFFHVPLAIARQLTRARRFEEAQTWLRYVFDPVAPQGGANPKAWRFGPFHGEQTRLQDEGSDALDLGNSDSNEIDGAVAQWEANPFNPHAIARLRPLGYMRATFFAYLDNLIAWADDLFRRDTMESVGEALQLYVHAAQLLGPQPFDASDLAPPQPALTLQQQLDAIADGAPLSLTGGNAGDPDADAPAGEFFNLFGRFCMPGNDRLKSYWATLSDRLFKIRHCRDIDGAVRKLALFAPPIDPAMLVRAAAAGIDIGAAVAGLSAPRPHYRFAHMLQKANEFTGEVRSFGNALLAALEKKDGEALQRLRNDHEVAINRRLRDNARQRVAEAQETYDAATLSVGAALARRDYYDGLLAAGLIAPEKNEERLQGIAALATASGQVLEATSASLCAIPDTGSSGMGPHFVVGGKQFGDPLRAAANVLQSGATIANFLASMAGRKAGFERREQEWAFAREQAKDDVARLTREQTAAELRLALAEAELADQELRIAQGEEVSQFLRGKFTGEALYGWMAGELSALHYQAYQLALGLARQAEACLAYELGNGSPGIIGNASWDSGRKGLLAGDRLSLDLRRLEQYYMSENARISELRKNVSLVRLDPAAMLALRQTGSCEFELPEAIFDLDHPGHYRRRIKSVALTIPAVAGPQTTVGCTLELQESMIRDRPEFGEDPDLALRSGTVQRMHSSSAQNDAGLFVVDFRDERYLPFEGAGAVSRWKLELPGRSIAQFDYDGIADVILHLSYTAEYAPDWRAAVEARLAGDIDSRISAFASAPEALPLTIMLSLRYDFPAQWAALVNGATGETLELAIEPGHFPYLFAGRAISVAQVAAIPVERQAQQVPASLELGPASPLQVPAVIAVDLAQLSDAGSLEGLRDISLIVTFTSP